MTCRNLIPPIRQISTQWATFFPWFITEVFPARELLVKGFQLNLCNASGQPRRKWWWSPSKLAFFLGWKDARTDGGLFHCHVWLKEGVFLHTCIFIYVYIYIHIIVALSHHIPINLHSTPLTKSSIRHCCFMNFITITFRFYSLIVSSLLLTTAPQSPWHGETEIESGREN